MYLAYNCRNTHLSILPQNWGWLPRCASPYSAHVSQQVVLQTVWILYKCIIIYIEIQEVGQEVERCMYCTLSVHVHCTCTLVHVCVGRAFNAIAHQHVLHALKVCLCVDVHVPVHEHVHIHVLFMYCSCTVHVHAADLGSRG